MQCTLILTNMIILKVLSTMQTQLPILVPTQHHPLTMPIAVPPVLMNQPSIIPNDKADAYVPIVNNMAANAQNKRLDRKRQMSIEMTTIIPSHEAASTINKMHMPLPLPNLLGTEDRGKLAELQIANERRRRRAVMEAHAEQERRADDPNIFNNNMYEPNTKTLVVHERRTKSHQQKQKSDKP
jgi:hypothetical protein